ncbi:hypothetical protein HGRIS_009557 [Hohenbuehelia grisea]|uniref:Xylanolytic transcriptional activator regulatory domain-containing protein n=1 Tax=Hohenbuehelia grisea TaxID=104357 RepID=A0ABR3J1J2_9AGAR
MVKATESMSPSVASLPVTGKRKKTESEEPNGSASGSKKQRTRVRTASLAENATVGSRKKTPCSHCLARKVPDLCQPYTPGKTDQDLNVRIARLEHIIELALPQFCTPGTPSVLDGQPQIERRRSSSLVDDDGQSQPDEQDPSGGSFHSGKWYGNSASTSVAPSAVLEQLKNVAPNSGENGETSRASLNGQPNGLTSIIDAVAEPTAADNLKYLVQECGVSPHKISELLQELPPLRISDVLIDYYFASINWTRYPVSERDFRTAYNSIRAHGADGIAATNPNDVRFLPLLFVVLAIAVRLAPEDIGGDARNRRVTSLRYYWSSRRSLLIAAAIQPDSLDIVLTRLLPGMDSAQVEYRRRIWSYLYHADRSYALVLGRPNSIHDDYTSTKAPSNIDDDNLPPNPRAALDLSHPTPMTFVILRHQLAAIIGRIVHHFQQVRTASHYSEVISLDDELLKFIETLPPHFSLDPDTSLDESLTFIPVHRFLLITEILFVRIGLHRPYLLRRLRSERYNRSRTACFESAMKDFRVRRAFRESMAKEKRDPLSNAYREFQTAMISGIYLVLHPRGRDAQNMHDILDAFMKEHDGIRDMDETTRRELKTIEFLKSKASQADLREGGPKAKPQPTHPHTNNAEPAQLLLNLQSAGAVTPSPQPSFASIAGGTDAARPSPLLDYAAVTPLSRSPTFQRLQSHAEVPHSPTGSGSPIADEESAAQSLLDHWCNTISGPPTDGFAGSMSWGPSGTGDFAGWVGAAPTATTADPRLLNGLDTDWSYWETLVNQIRGP